MLSANYFIYQVSRQNVFECSNINLGYTDLFSSKRAVPSRPAAFRQAPEIGLNSSLIKQYYRHMLLIALMMHSFSNPSQSEVLGFDWQRHALKIVSALSSERNLKLFRLAEDGLVFDFSALARSGISRKQYYRGVRQLHQLGLLRRMEKRYYQSTLGIAIYQSMSRLSKLVVQGNAIQTIDAGLAMGLDISKVIDSLKQSGMLDADMVGSIEQSICGIGLPDREEAEEVKLVSS